MTARLVSFLITAFLVATVTIPVAAVNKLLFGLIAALAAIRVVSKPADSRLRTWSPLLILCVFLYGLILSLLGDADLGLARQLVFSVSLLLLIYPILWYDVNLDRAIKVAGIALALVTFVFLGVLVLAPSSPAAAALLPLFKTYSLTGAGLREFLGTPLFMFHLGSSPFLLLPFALFAADVRDRRDLRSLAALVLIGAAILASTSRGLFLVSAVAVALVALEHASTPRRVAWALAATPIVAVVFAVLVARTAVFSTADFSNAVKMGHAASFVDNLDFTAAIFGEGLASFYFSAGRAAQVAQTEITLLDMLRYVGFILTPLVFAALAFPSWRLWRYTHDGSRVIAVSIFVLYLMLSLTNPVLFNSFGLSVVVWYWWRLLRDPVDPVPSGAPA